MRAQEQRARALLAGAFDFRPIDPLTINLDLEHIEKAVPEPTVFLLTAPKSTATNLYPGITLPPLLDPDTNLGSSWMVNQAHEDNALLHLTYKINPAWEFTFDTGASLASRMSAPALIRFETSCISVSIRVNSAQPHS